MPELAEVEFNRKQWNRGLGQIVRAVELHPDKRIFRGTQASALAKALPGSKLLRSETHGKQMLFAFSNGLWLGVHLGMTGRLRVEPACFRPGKHDHLALFQKRQALVLADARQFGRVRFHQGRNLPPWWRELPADLSSRQFTVAVMENFLQRHRRLPIKSALLLQSGFPGIGNWMADEILWRAGVNPHLPAGRISGRQAAVLWKKLRFVCREALRRIGPTYSELPRGWLFHQRWNGQGRCPRHHTLLRREIIGGRTTAWCAKCQGGPVLGKIF